MTVIKNFQAFMAEGGLVCPPGKSKIEYGVFDEPGLFVECRQSATAVPVWWLRLKNAKGTNTYKKLGAVKDVSLAQARKLVKQLRSEHVMNLKAVGCNVVPGITSDQMTLHEFWTTIHLPQIKIFKRSWVKDESLYRLRIQPKFGDVRLSEINRRDVQAFHQNLLSEGLSAASCNHHIVLLKRCLSVAQSLDLIQKNCLRGIPLMPLDNLRDVFLTPEETARFVEVLRTDSNKPVCMALLYIANTASRKMETLKAKWVDIDMENKLWHIPAANNKSKRPKTLPLNSGALQVLCAQLELRGTSEYVFPNPADWPAIHNPGAPILETSSQEQSA
jgi:hypothetical protein